MAADLVSTSSTIKFYDRSALRATSWFWDFGDGQTSTFRNPVHVFASVGTYVVSLRATCGDQEDIISMTIEINFQPKQPEIDSVDFVSDERTATLVGYEEFTSASTPPLKYRRRLLDGDMVISTVYGSTTCAGTYAGDGTQSGQFPVYFFYNEIAEGTVVIRLDLVEDSVAYYTLVSSSWVVVGTPNYLTGGNYSFTRIAGVNRSPGDTFSLPVGTVFGVSIWIRSIFGYGIGEWFYEAGRSEFTDTWALDFQYDAVTGVLSNGGTATRDVPSGPYTINIPERTSILSVPLVETGSVLEYYAPRASLVVQLEPTYVSQSVSRLVKAVTGLGCVVGTGFGATSMSAVGTVNTTLSDEDLELDAVARANPSTGSLQVVKYQQRTGYSFEYRSVAVDIQLSNLIIGINYTVTIPLTVEDYGGGNPISSPVVYTFDAEAETYLLSDIILPEKGKQGTLGTPTVAFT